MHIFIGTVPFTLIEAINFVVANDIEDADLYLVKVFDKAEEVAERIKKANVFKNVYIVENVLLTYPITIKKCIEVVKNGKKLIDDLKNRNYDYAYYNNSGYLINSIFYTGINKGNSKCSHNFIEHGYYTYTTDYSDKPWYLKSLIRLIGLKCMDGSMLDKLYMFEPELMCTRHDGQVVKMKKIDKTNKKLIDTMNFVFNYNKNDNQFRDKDIIIMEQGPMKEAFDKEIFWNKITSYINKESAIIKAHPRQKNSTLQELEIEVSRNHTLPWEIEILNNDISNKIQMTIFSGTCVFPKLMFDEELTVIFLYKLLPIDYSFLGEKLVEFADRIGEQYKNKNKYFIPETFEELSDYCMKMKNSIRK